MGSVARAPARWLSIYTVATSLAVAQTAMPGAPTEQQAPLIKPEAPAGAVAAADCGSVVLIKCDKPAAAGPPVVAPPDRQRRDAARRMEHRRVDQAFIELDRLVVEGDGERRSPEDIIGSALGQPLLREGTHSFSIGESAQCTCMNVCPPMPFPCCSCTDRVGSRMSTTPGWKPTN